MPRRLTKDDHTQAARALFSRTREQLGINALDFDEWLPTVTPQWRWDWPHQKYLYKKLQQITDGSLKRLMIFMPPRHSKTETVTVRYAAYRLERDPRLNVILGCYNQHIANKFSRKTRRIAEQRIALARDRKAVEEWETAIGGGFRAVGVGAGITGFGGNLILIDDPVKNREEAESQTYRERCWEWFWDDLYTRQEPNASIILTMTRWHDDDLAGRLIREMERGGERWEIVRLPAIAEDGDPLRRQPGEALCPDRYDVRELERIREGMSSYSWASLYQQRPVPIEGALFKLDHFKDKIVDEAPPNLRWVRGYDLAVSQKTKADRTASFRCAFDKQGNLYIADGFVGRIEYPEQKRYVMQRMIEEHGTEHGIEKALHGLALVQDLRRERSVRHVPFKAVNVDTDKYTRALAWANLAADGKVFLVRGGWTAAFLEEVVRFTGKGDTHDDQVDAVSVAVRMLSKRRSRLMAF